MLTSSPEWSSSPAREYLTVNKYSTKVVGSPGDAVDALIDLGKDSFRNGDLSTLGFAPAGRSIVLFGKKFAVYISEIVDSSFRKAFKEMAASRPEYYDIMSQITPVTYITKTFNYRAAAMDVDLIGFGGPLFDMNVLRRADRQIEKDIHTIPDNVSNLLVRGKSVKLLSGALEDRAPVEYVAWIVCRGVAIIEDIMDLLFYSCSGPEVIRVADDATDLLAIQRSVYYPGDEVVLDEIELDEYGSNDAMDISPSLSLDDLRVPDHYFDQAEAPPSKYCYGMEFEDDYRNAAPFVCINEERIIMQEHVIRTGPDHSPSFTGVIRLKNGLILYGPARPRKKDALNSAKTSLYELRVYQMIEHYDFVMYAIDPRTTGVFTKNFELRDDLPTVDARAGDRYACWKAIIKGTLGTSALECEYSGPNARDEFLFVVRCRL